MGGNRVRYRVHAGEERPPRRIKRFVGLKYDGELDQVVTPHPYQRPRAGLRRDVAAMRKCIAEFAQRDQSITGRQVERLFHFSWTSDHAELILKCFAICGCMLSRASRSRERPLHLADISRSGYRRTVGRSNRPFGAQGSGYSKMSASASRLLICSCEKTMPLDPAAIGRGCAAEITQANQLCGLELDRFKQALASGSPITVACTQEAPLFREVAENSPQAQLTFVNIRETGGWSKDAAAAGPKAAALIAAAGEDMPPISLVTLESSGVALIYGRDEVAIDAAQRLADRFDITVLLTQARRRDPAPNQRIPGSQGHHPQCPRTSRAVRACDRRLCAATAVLAREARVRIVARRRDLDLRSDPRSVGRQSLVSRA